ncbi:MAG TPA: methyl-accepting chemotaxis protein [Treponemataceae bacterium]|nr:methyl-accepting chemotaxis protein [Treponemataceae bacterium]HPS43021.1 methyl-accepting chemotaxis protein [Treponemataceae bacterium]
MRFKIAGKLVFFGSLIIIIPFCILAIVVSMRATDGISKLSTQNLMVLAESMADTVEDRFEGDIRLCTLLAHDADVVSAAKLAESGDKANATFSALSAKFAAFKGNSQFSSTQDVFLLIDGTGHILAASRSGLVGLDVSKRDYFQTAIAGKSEVSQIMKSADGVITASASVPVMDENGKIIGVSVISILMDSVTNDIQKYKLGKSGYFMGIDHTGLVVFHPEDSMVLKMNMNDYPEMKDTLNGALSGKPGVRQYTFQGVSRVAAYSTVPANGWVIMAVLPEAELFDTANAIRGTIIVIAIISVIAAIIVFILFAQSLSKPIKHAAEFAMKIAEGNVGLTVHREFLERGDEIGMLAEAFKVQCDKLSYVAREIASASANVSQGSEQLSDTSQQMSQGATEQASSLEEISSSVEQMTANIKQNAENARVTESIAKKTATSAEEGGKAVTQTVDAMRSIASKIGIIEEIARSTNMLALNASIEAARAGEYGKGFAVVASEVGKLADRSQKEAGEISKLSAESVQIAETAGKTILAIIPDIKKTADLVQEISAASDEQNAGAQQINQALMQLDQVVQQNASASEESASMAEELSGQAVQLSETISFFKLGNETAGSADAKKPIGGAQATAQAKAMPAIKPVAAVPKATPTSALPKAHAREGIVLNLDDDGTGHAGFDAEDANFKEF